jgi:hypothetical protein
MGDPERFGYSEFGTTENDLSRKRKIHPVAGRHKKGFHRCLGTQTISDQLIFLILIMTVSASLCIGRIESENR